MHGAESALIPAREILWNTLFWEIRNIVYEYGTKFMKVVKSITWSVVCFCYASQPSLVFHIGTKLQIKNKRNTGSKLLWCHPRWLFACYQNFINKQNLLGLLTHWAIQTTLLLFKEKQRKVYKYYTVCPRRSYIVSYYMKWVTTSWTYSSNINHFLFPFLTWELCSLIAELRIKKFVYIGGI